MPKRKAESQLNQSPSKRQTRTYIPLTNSQNDDHSLRRSPRKASGVSVVPETPTKPRQRKRNASPKYSSLKENADSEESLEESDDDLLLTPANSRQDLSRVIGTRTSSRKQPTSSNENTFTRVAAKQAGLSSTHLSSPPKKSTIYTSSYKRKQHVPRIRSPPLQSRASSSLGSSGPNAVPLSSSLSPASSHEFISMSSSPELSVPENTGLPRSPSHNPTSPLVPSKSPSPVSEAIAEDILLEVVSSESEEEDTQGVENFEPVAPSSDPFEPAEETIWDREPIHPPAPPSVSPPTSPTERRRGRPLSPEGQKSSFSICLNAQKRAILASLTSPMALEHNAEESNTSCKALAQLTALLNGSIERGETNSCLVIGARNSGKTKLVDDCIAQCAVTPIVVRLSGWAQADERQAIKEIGWQLNLQTGQNFDVLNQEADGGADEDEDHFWGGDKPGQLPLVNPQMPPAHRISELISSLPKLPRPTVVVLEAIDLFALHGRQALLYCLFDMVQSSRPGGGRCGVTVIGVTNRIDTITLFEKRVKSRFSGRVINVTPPGQDNWQQHARSILCPAVVPLEASEQDAQEWASVWDTVVEDFLSRRDVCEMLEDTYSLTADLSLLGRLLMGPVLELDASFPQLRLSSESLILAVRNQRSRDRTALIHSLPYPAICILIAFVHMRTSGHDAANFEMLFRSFSDQVSTSSSAPVQINGASIGMMRCSRGVLLDAFQSMISTGILLPVGSGNNVSQEFIKYKCTVEFATIKRAVASTANANLVKWLGKNSRS